MRSSSKYKASFSIGVANSMEYRFDFFMGLLSTIFPIIIQIFLWYAIYNGNDAEIMYEYTFPQMIMYVTVAGAVSKFVMTGVENYINEDIHTGGLAKYLVKPVSYIPFRLFGVIGEKFMFMITMFGLTGILIGILKAVLGFNIEIIKQLLFIPSLLFAALLNFFLFFCISTLAFHLTEVGKFFHAIGVTIMVVGGGVFPVEVLGTTYISIIKWLPFIYTTGFPIGVVTGAMDLNDIFTGMGIQALWILILALISNVLWRNGIKHYVAVGG